jgi:hypothetical protein
MIAKEGLPALPPSLCHVFCYGRLADIDAELEHLAEGLGFRLAMRPATDE